MDDKKSDVLAVGDARIEFDDGTVVEGPAEISVKLLEGPTEPGEERQRGCMMGYSRRYSDAWERTFGKREAN